MKIRKIIYVLKFILFISLSLSENLVLPNCLTDPSSPECENFVLPNGNVTRDINMLCSMMPNMPGCTVSRQCAYGYGSGPYCAPFSHLKEICTEMPMMGCEEYNSICLPNNTRVKECGTPVLPLPTLNGIWTQISLICKEMFMPDCNRCQNMGTCDVLSVYSSLCVSMPMMKQCADWKDICGLVPGWVICGGVPTPNCLSYPWLTGCENYILPNDNVTSDVNQLCSMMPNMPGCTISRECANGRGTGTYCAPFSHLKQICTEMPMMGCEDYNSLCLPNNTIVKECDTLTLPLPTQHFLWTQISEMCKEMAMPDCDKCPNGNCDVLQVYFSICYSMPGMPQCSTWHSICGIIPDWVICAGDPDKLQPIMRMYFHTDIADYILFYQWVPRDTLTYVLSVIGVLLIAFLHEGLRTIKTILEYKLRKRESQKFRETTPLQSNTSANYSESRYPPFNFFKEFFRAILRTLDTTLHFLIMLITMTFNVGLFVAVMVGYCLGYLVFGRFSRPMEPLILTGMGEEDVSCH